MNQAVVLQIISSASTQQFNVVWIELQSPVGGFLVGPDHAPLVSLITTDSKLIYKKIDGSLGMFSVPGGVLRVEDNQVSLILSSPLGAALINNG